VIEWAPNITHVFRIDSIRIILGGAPAKGLIHRSAMVLREVFFCDIIRLEMAGVGKNTQTPSFSLREAETPNRCPRIENVFKF
jgi:hypothetical protein